MGQVGIGHGRLAGVLALGAVVVGAGMGLISRGPPVVPLPPMQSQPSATTYVEVHVVGWVARPGVVSVPAGSLVVDAIVAAGGLRLGARVEAINLAAALAPGQQVVVPGPQPEGAEASTGATVGGKVSVNRATQSELETLPGVGPVLAGRIVAYRDQHGPFSTVEDLLDVPGIGEAKLASIRDLVSVP